MYVVLIVCCVIVVFFLIQVASISDTPTTSVPIDPTLLQTGDLVGVSYHHLTGRMTTAWCSSLWGHTGIAWRAPDTNELFILETARYGRGYNGIVRVPFDLWARINRRQKVCWLKLHNTGVGVDAGRMDTFFKQLQPARDVFNPDAARYLLRRPYKEQTVDELTKHRLNCYEVTIILLQKMGIVAKKYAYSSYSPGDIINRRIHMAPGYTYAAAVGLLPIPK